MSRVIVETVDDVSVLVSCVLSAVYHEGLSVQTADGRPATLAVIDSEGKVLESGQQVCEEAWNIAIRCFQRHLDGEGALRVSSGPLGMLQEEECELHSSR